MFERLLERISLSKYKSNFILKGGMLIVAMIGIDARSTMDMDITTKKIDIADENLEKILNEILLVPIDDNIKMKLLKIEKIRGNSNYSGIRVSIEALIDKTKQIMKVDITTGDVITPGETIYNFKLLIEDRSIDVLTYNIETILAEKLETILSRSTATTRMRDYYDFYMLTSLKNSTIQWDLFNRAFKNTSENRGSYNQIIKSGHLIINEIESSKILSDLWGRYQKKNNYASELNWIDNVKCIKKVYRKL